MARRKSTQTDQPSADLLAEWLAEWLAETPRKCGLVISRAINSPYKNIFINTFVLYYCGAYISASLKHKKT